MSSPVALVTGAGSGIGSATARVLVEQGYRVALCGRRPEPLAALGTELDALVVPTDVTDRAAVAALAEAVSSQFGRLDGLVLNAGVIYSTPLASPDDAEWSATLRTNLDGAMYVARACLPLLQDSGGSVVSVASVAASRASAGTGAYSAAKAALTMLTATIAVEYGAAGVRANTVAPGWVRTEMADAEMDAVAAAGGLDREGAYTLATSLVPLRRPGTAREIAQVIAFLLSPAAAYVTGAVLPVDGGLTVVDPGMAPLSG